SANSPKMQLYIRRVKAFPNIDMSYISQICCRICQQNARLLIPGRSCSSHIARYGCWSIRHRRKNISHYGQRWLNVNQPKHAVAVDTNLEQRHNITPTSRSPSHNHQGPRDTFITYTNTLPI
ncbi:unnamed protein product, partial [Owenia fusiformis]